MPTDYKTGQLREYDVKLIQSIKSQNPSLGALKKVWAERCGIAVEMVQTRDIVSRLAQIAEELGLTTVASAVFMAAPGTEWRYALEYEETDDPVESYLRRWLSYLSSTLRHAKVSELPGYERR